MPLNMTEQKLSQPPIPQRLRDLLRDYPEYLQTLQNRLNKVAQNPPDVTPVFEQAIWALEDGLDEFLSEARAELRAAEARGDAEAIARAAAKKRLMFSAFSRNDGMRGLHELKLYFDANKVASE